MAVEMLDSLRALASHLWRGVHWEKFPDGPRCVREPLKTSHVQAHLSGGRGVGCAPIVPGESVTRAALFDLDDHSGDMGWPGTVAAAKRLLAVFPSTLHPRCVRSSGGKGIHIYLLWQEPQDAYSVREFMRGLLDKAGLKSGTKGLQHKEVEIFPKQDEVKPDGVGSMWILPFSRESVPLDENLNLLDIAAAIRPNWWLHSQPVPLLERPKRDDSAIADPLTDAELIRLKDALDAIPNEDLSYDEWRNIIFAIHHATGGSEQGRALAESFSAKSPKHDTNFFNNRVWPYIRHDRGGPIITAASIFAKAREHGFDDSAATLQLFADLIPETPEMQAFERTRDKYDGALAALSDTKPEDKEALRYTILRPSDLAQRPPPDWLVRNILPRSELIVLYGESTAGKSFIALDLAYAIAAGIPWREMFDAKPGKVVYVCAEGVGGFTLRIKALLKAHGGEDFNVGTLPEAPNFLTVEDVRDVIKAVQAFGKTDLVIVDTLAQVSPGGNENSGEDMGKILGHCKAIHRCTGATVMLIHHAGKDLTRGARGWSGLKAAADAELEVSRLENEGRIVRVSKMKDGQDGAIYPFRLKPVPVDVDADGNVIESCIVEHIQPSDVIESRGPKLSGEWQRAVYGMALNLQTMGAPEGVKLDELVTAVLKHRGVLGTEDDTRQTRGNIRRAITTLEERRLLFIDETGRVQVRKTESEEIDMNERENDDASVSNETPNGFSDLM